jgi:hypothetical protein
MTIAAFWAWALANQASLATVLLVISELLGAFPQVKANGIASFIILQIEKVLKDKGGRS